MKKWQAFFALVLLIFWTLSSLPRIWHEPDIPPQVGQVQALSGVVRPNGDTTTNQWTPTPSGTHYTTLTASGDLVTQPTAPDTSNNLNNGGSSGNSERLQMETISGITSATAITVWIYGQSTKANSSLTVNLYWDGSAQQYGSVSLGTANSWQSASFTGLSLTQSQLDSLEVFISGGAGGRTYTVHALYADVTYSAISISLTTDGSVSFGYRALDSTIDTTASGINDPETVSVDSGPADLNVRSTVFTQGANTWSLGTSNGANQVKWEFSKDGSAWTTFALADTLYALDTNVPQGNTRNLYLRLTTPTASDSYLQYSSTVTIIASAP